MSFGDSVALSHDGATALVGGLQDGGGAGAAWVFARAGAAWAQQGSKLTGGEERGSGEFGWSVALSGEGATALVGGIGDGAKTGAAWAFADPSLAGGEPPGGDGPSGGTPGGGEPASGTQTQAPAGSPPGVTPRAKQGVGAYQGRRWRGRARRPARDRAQRARERGAPVHGLGRLPRAPHAQARAAGEGCKTLLRRSRSPP